MLSNRLPIRLLIFIMALLSCNDQTKEYSESDKIRIQEIKDSLTNKINSDVNDKVYGDTIGLSTSPVIILSYKIVKSESGSYRNVKISYKNTSDKQISAIRFMWKGINAFGEPADLGSSFANGYGGGFTDEGLGAGKSSSGIWEILSKDAKELTMAWPTEVIFVDKTKWLLKK